MHRLNSAVTLIQRTTTEAPRGHMYYIGLDVHKKTISYCVKDASGRMQQEGKVEIGSSVSVDLHAVSSLEYAWRAFVPEDC